MHVDLIPRDQKEPATVWDDLSSQARFVVIALTALAVFFAACAVGLASLIFY